MKWIDAPLFAGTVILLLAGILTLPLTAQDLQRGATQPEKNAHPAVAIKQIQNEQTAEAASLSEALASAGSSKEREALAAAFAERNDARMEKLRGLMDKVETVGPVGARPTVEERIPADASAKVKAALREQYVALDELEGLKESTKAMSSEQRSAAYRQWSEASAGRLEQARQTLAVDLERQTARQPAGKELPGAPANLSAEGKAAWNRRSQWIAGLEELKESTKKLSSEARSAAYTQYLQANAAAMEQSQRQLEAEAGSPASKTPAR